MKKKSQKQIRQSTVVEMRLKLGLQEVDRHIEAKNWLEAQPALEDLYRRFPDQPEVLSRLLNTSYEIGDTERYQEICETLLALMPDDVELTLALAGAYMLNSRPALARKTFTGFLDHWPDHESALEVQKSKDEIDRFLADAADENHLNIEDAVRLMELHERMQSLHYQGRNRQAIHLGEKIVHEFPDYIPAYNNLSQLHWLMDKREKAIQYNLSALEIDAQNFHARANLVIYRLLTGEVQQAYENAAMLKVADDTPLPHVFKMMEAFSYLGDDHAVLEAYVQTCSRADFKKMSHGAAMIHHLAGVAFLRQGKETEARDCWDLAIEISPTFENARANRLDLEKPTHFRHSPWAFRIAQWLPESTVRELLRGFDPSTPLKDTGAMQQAARTFLEKNPAVIALTSFMLDLGDESTRDFILVLARYTDDISLLEAVREFASGKRAPDQARLEAAQILVQAGVLPSGMKSMWINGKWMEILVAGIRISGDTRQQHGEQVSKLLKEAFNLLEMGDGEAAESLLQEASAIEPDAQDVLFNLAASYQLQGKEELSELLVERIHLDHPDYLFGRTGLVQILIGKKELDRAREVLEPLFLTQEMKSSEFDAFCGVNIELNLAEKNVDAARAWFGLWDSVNPSNPKLDRYRWQLGDEKD